MEMATLGGLVIAVATVVATVFLEGGSLGLLWGPSAMILIMGGTLGATVMSHATADVVRLPQLIGQAFRAPRHDPATLAEALVALSDRARRQGLLSLQDDPNIQAHPLLARGITMVVDGLPAETVREALETEVLLKEERDRERAAMFDTAGGYAPTIGIIGTVFGLILVLSNLSDAESLGHSIAVAFLACFYGIATANLWWLPLGAKLKQQAAEERRLGEMIIHGLSALQAGQHPRSIQERLAVFLPEGKAKEAAGRAATKEVEAS